MSLPQDTDVARKEIDMWLDNLKRLKQEKGMTTKQIAEKTNLPEKTISRILSGDTINPYVDTIQRIATAFDASLDDVFADTKVVVATETLAEVKENVNSIEADLAVITAENVSLKAEITALVHEIEMLRMEIKHKDDLLALHDFYNKRK